MEVPDRCRAIYLVTHLFWTPNSEQKKDDKRVLEAIRKAIKVADTYLDSAVKNDLFVEILNECLYYFENACESVRENEEEETEGRRSRPTTCPASSH